MNKIDLYPHPGRLPDRPEPKVGKIIRLKISGYPPYKDVKFSIRNIRHKHYERFKMLRKMAIDEMDGQKWYEGPVGINLEIYAPNLEGQKDLIDYVGGVMDTLDGSHGPSFTYLPIIYQNDCQVSLGRQKYIKSTETYYNLEIKFL